MPVRSSFTMMHVIVEPRYAGAEVLVRELAQIHRSQGHQVAIVAFRPPQPDFVPEITNLQHLGCSFFLPTRRLEKLGRVKWVREAVATTRPDIVFAHSILPSLYARLALRFAEHPQIVTVLHTDDDLNDGWLLRLERLLWKRNACVVGVSANSVENYRRRLTDRVPTRVIQNGIQVENFAVSRGAAQDLRSRLYKPKDSEILAVQVGRICLQKQQHVSVEGLARLSARGIRNIRLVLIGGSVDSAYRARMSGYARDAGVEDRVHFAGPQGNVRDWLAGADIFLMPSAWEAHSIAALEGLASGLCCIFTEIDSFEAWRSCPGVFMIPIPPSGEELGQCLEAVANSKAWERRFERDLGNFSMLQCAAKYMQITEEFAHKPL